MKRRVLVFSLMAFFALGAVAVAAAKFNDVKPQEFDPAKTELVQASWVDGIGCPTDAQIAPYDSATNSAGPAEDYEACESGDSKDKHNQGLLLAKTGPTRNFASAGAELKNVKGQTVTELGYDIRKPDSKDDPRGSHCGGGAPRFNVYTSSGTEFVGCNQMSEVAGATDGWVRLRATNLGFADVQAIEIIADEGTDAGPDNFGVSILDNIDVNEVLVGQGPKDAD